jgi:large subunit ribosomal protein L4
LSVTEEGQPSARKRLIFGRKLQYLDNINLKLKEPRQAWIDNFENTDTTDKRGLIELHPEIFGAFPRAELVHQTYNWQQKYKKINWKELMHRTEMLGQGPRPWPQKGTGRARHRDRRSPIWKNGGWAHPPKLRTFFYMENFFVRVRGLISVLAAKQAQNDLVVVDTLDNFPYDDPKDLDDFIAAKGWGASVLISDIGDIFPEKISLASESLNHVNLMPVYGLNVVSMLKHETLVLTVAALEEIESKLMYHLKRTDIRKVVYKFRPPEVGHERDPFMELPR